MTRCQTGGDNPEKGHWNSLPRTEEKPAQRRLVGKEPVRDANFAVMSLLIPCLGMGTQALP